MPTVDLETKRAWFKSKSTMQRIAQQVRQGEREGVVVEGVCIMWGEEEGTCSTIRE